MIYFKDTYLVQNNPENTGLLPANAKSLRQKKPINPLYTVLNSTFTKKGIIQVVKDHKKGDVDIQYLEEHQQGIIEAYSNYYGEDWKTILKEDLDTKDFLGTGLRSHGEKSPRSIHISLNQWENYQSKEGYDDYCFSCEARPDIIVFDFDIELTEEQIQKIIKAFKKQLYVIEQNTLEGTLHIYIQGKDNTPITKVKAGIKEKKEDKEPLDIDIFKGGLKHVSCSSPNRPEPYTILYNGEPTKKITTRNAIRMLSKTLDYYLDNKTLDSILTQNQQQQKTTTKKTTATGEIEVTSNSELDNQRAVTIVENAIPIFTKLAGKGIREELYKSLAGALLRHGFNNNETLQIMTNIYNNTNDKDPRLKTVENTIRRYQEDETISGWTKFQKLVKEQNNNKLRLGGNLNRIADAIFINQPPVVKTLNPITETIETGVLITNNNEQIFEELPEATENNETLHIIKNSYNDYQIIIDYKKKNIAKRILKTDKKGNITHEDSLVITAVPEELEVYNDTICNAGKQYKCKWTYEDGTVTEVTGDITLHNKTLQKGAGVWNKNQLQNTISAIFGELTKTKAHGTVIKNTPLQKGFYYDKDTEKIIVVGHEITRPTPEQLAEAIEVLDLYGSYFGYPQCTEEYTTEATGEALLDTMFTVDPSRLAVFLRWCLNAPFHFVRKQMGMTNDQYIFLLGESGVGKTYGYFMAGLFMLGVENPKEYMVSGGSNSKAQISKNLAKTTFPILIDEGDRIVGKEDITSLLKHAVQGIYSRDVTDTETNQLTKELALAQLGFSANNVFEDTEKGALTNRIIEIPFYSRDIPTKERKQKFEQEFNTQYTPEDKRQALKWIGYEFQARILENPKIYLHKDPDDVVKEFFEDICRDTYSLDWICNDIDTKTAEDERLQRRDNLCDILKTILNKEMKYTIVKEDHESTYKQYLLDDPTLTPKGKITLLAESQKVSWLYTNKHKNYLILTSGVIRAIKKEDPNININNLEELKDILVTQKYTLYDIGRYRVNDNGKSQQIRNSLKVDVEVISDLYEQVD